MSTNVKIIICTEKGILEKYSLLLCRSIRKYAGDLSDIEIHSYAPRKSFFPSSKTIQLLKHEGVHHHNLDLNKKYKYYSLANKPFVCEQAEKQFPNSILIFIDSDQVIFNSFEKIINLLPNQVFVRPVDFKGVGCSDEKDNNYTYWKKLQQELKYEDPKIKVKTSVGEDIYPYFNTGLLAVNSALGVFSQWRMNLEMAIKKKLFPADKFFLEQSLFTATLFQKETEWQIMPKTYNYPISAQSKISSELIVDTNQIVTAHYHNLLVIRPLPDYFDDFLNNTDKGKWLKQQIEELNIKPPTSLEKLINKAKKKLFKKFF